MPKVTLVSRDGTRHQLDAPEGSTLMEAVKDFNDEIEAACGGNVACATCHVIVEANWFAKLPTPKREELEMLELATGLTTTSRLACQIRLTDALDGLSVRLPK